MFDWLLSTDGFVPRKACGAWTPQLIFLHSFSDIAIWLAYLSIPVALVYFTRRGGLRQLNRVVWLFAAFILCCGFAHFIEALMFEKPLYRLAGAMKAITAAVSWLTVLVLIPSMPTLIQAFRRVGEPTGEMPALGAMAEVEPTSIGAGTPAKIIVALLAATLAMLVCALFEPIIEGKSAFFIPLLAVVFVAWHSGFWPAILTLFSTFFALMFFFIDPNHSIIVESLADQLSIGMFLFAGVACAMLGQAQHLSSRRAAHHLFTAQSRQRELETLLAQLSASQRQTTETLAQLDMFVTHAPLGMAFFDRDMRIVRINKELADVAGLAVEEPIGKSMSEIARIIPLEGFIEPKKVLETGEAVTNQLLVGKADVAAVAGRVWQSSYYPVREPDGSLMGVGVVTHEISQKIRDEKALKESEAQFRSLAESMPQFVWVCRPDGYAEYFNPKWYEYTCRGEGESLGWAWLDAIHPSDRVHAEQTWTQSIRTGEVYEINYRIRRIDGVYRWFLGRGLPQRDETGEIIRWFGTCTDIDDAKRTEDELKQSEALLQLSHMELGERVALRTVELSEAVAALQDEVDFRRRAEERVVAAAAELRRSNVELEQFAYVASHDLQEPLRKIQAFGDRLKIKCGPLLGADGIDYIERMLSSSSRMRQLINDLLAYSRLSTKARSFAPVKLAGIAAGVLSDLEIRIQQTLAQVRVGALPTIDADPLQMRQLFQNLLSNSLKFARAGVAPDIEISAEIIAGDRPLCRLRFRDNGIGFDVKYLDRIFQMFQRLHGRGEYEGTGVGLAICHKIVHLHGGNITAESAPGHGATFLATLPVHQSVARAEIDDT